jgi:hypothetical protein
MLENPLNNEFDVHSVASVTQDKELFDRRGEPHRGCRQLSSHTIITRKQPPSFLVPNCQGAVRKHWSIDRQLINCAPTALHARTRMKRGQNSLELSVLEIR